MVRLIYHGRHLPIVSFGIRADGHLEWVKNKTTEHDARSTSQYQSTRRRRHTLPATHVSRGLGTPCLVAGLDRVVLRFRARKEKKRQWVNLEYRAGTRHHHVMKIVSCSTVCSEKFGTGFSFIFCCFFPSSLEWSTEDDRGVSLFNDGLPAVGSKVWKTPKRQSFRVETDCAPVSGDPVE